MKITVNPQELDKKFAEYSSGVYLQWDEKNTPLSFAILDNEYEYVNTFGNKALAFTVFDATSQKVKILSITSKRFLGQLKPFLPEAGKALLRAVRTGTGTKTQFKVEKIGSLNPEQYKLIEAAPELDKTKLCRGN